MPPKNLLSNSKKNVHKPKKKAKKKPTDLIEPYRKSVLDIMKESLRSQDRTFLLSRLTIAGSHRWDMVEMQIMFKQAVIKANEDITTCDKLSGMLLCYKKLYCCILEGSEDVIANFILDVYDDPDEEYYKSAKILTREAHIAKRYSSDWFEYSGTPNTLLTKPDKQNATLEDKFMILAKCMDKMFSLISLLEKANDDNLNKEKLSMTSNELGASHSVGTAASKRNFSSRDVCEAADLYKDQLVEVEIIEFLLDQVGFLVPLENMTRLYINPMCLFVDNYDENIWPIAQARAIYTIFETDYEPIGELPKMSWLQQSHDILIAEEENPE